ncbi:MAG TPA: YihY/virulence factor BrkB family protein [Caulobacteraceae bacterium]|nr:YihY/virulence factor BrkB family protein [Caulobacteraceae bacterium]
MSSKSPPRRPWTSHPAVRLAGGAAALFAAGLALGHRLEHRRHRALPPAPPDEPAAFELRDPGRGRAAPTPTAIPHRGWTDIAWRVLLGYFGDRVHFLAGGVTFFALLSLVPALSTFVALYGLFAQPDTAWKHLSALYDVFPPIVADFLGDEMRRLAEQRKASLSLQFLGSLALALWTANAAIKALFYGLNIAYHETEKRNVVRYNILAMAFTVGGLAFVLVTTALVVLVPLAVGLLGYSLEAQRLEWLRWPALLAIYWFALTLAYRFGPCRQHARWRWLSLGALFAAFASLGVSLLFSWYLTAFADFSRSYGPLGALMGFMLWTWLSVQVVLVGAALNAETEHQTAVDTTTGEPLPIGQRGALVADTIGPRRGSPRAMAYTMKSAEELARRRKYKDGQADRGPPAPTAKGD